MLAWFLSRLSYANVASTLALFVALGGTSVAALHIGSKQIRDNSVASVDVRNNDLRSRDVRDGDLTGRDIRDQSIGGADLGPGSVGPTQVANLMASDFAPGQLPPPLPTTLPTGKTLTGVFTAAVTGGSGDNGIARTPISFGIPLAQEPTEHYIATGAGRPAECAGSPADPTAAPGHLCLYEAGTTGPVVFSGIFHPVTGDNNQASRFGAVAFVNGGTGAAVRGTWAVTGQ